jgi:hypothetical protein
MDSLTWFCFLVVVALSNGKFCGAFFGCMQIVISVAKGP